MATTVRSVREPGLSDVLRAKEVLAGRLAATPLIASPLLGDGVMLKLETLQPTGSFKVRGALVAVASAIADDPNRSVVTASAGNHGLGVAYAAQTLGVRATIVVPENSSPAKQAALGRFDAELVRHGKSYEESEEHALFLSRSGARFISAYNDPDVIAGQGTIALELFEQFPDLTSIVAPVGGGGLLAGLRLPRALARRFLCAESRLQRPWRSVGRPPWDMSFPSKSGRRSPTAWRGTSRRAL